MAAIEVRVSQGGSVVQGQLRVDPAIVARCTLCEREVDAAAAIGGAGYACAPCLRERLDAMSVARFRLRDARPAEALPWGKVTG